MIEITDQLQRLAATSTNGRCLNRCLSTLDLLSDEAQACLLGLRDLKARLAELGYRVWPRDGSITRRDVPFVHADHRLEHWILEWQILSACQHLALSCAPSTRILVVGGAGSLLTCFLASLGCKVSAVDFPQAPLKHGFDAIVKGLGFTRTSMLPQALPKLEFADEYFDYAVCGALMHHLDYLLKQELLSEVARCLSSQGVLSLTFEYGNAVPFIVGYGEDTRLRNRLSTPEDIQRSFLETGLFAIEGDCDFCDDARSPVQHSRIDGIDYTMAALHLRKTQHPGTVVFAAAPLAAVEVPTLPAELLPEPTRVPDAAVQAGEPSRAAYPFLTVVICTYKRPALLRKALQSMLEQKLDRVHFEVVVVDNNSEDETPEVVRIMNEKAGNIRCVRERKQGLSHSRNRGCEEAKGDYVIYIDDDAKAHAKFLSLIRETIQEHAPDIMGGPIYPYYSETKPAWFKDEYEIRHHARSTGWSTTCSVSGSSFVIRRGLLIELGLFDPNLGMVGDTVRLGEERAVLNRYRQRPVEEQKVYYHLSCLVYHHVPVAKMTPRYLLKRYFVAGHAKAQIERLNRKRWGLFARGYYVARSWAGRIAAPFLSWRNEKTRRKFKQFLLERGLGFMFEVGRIAGCFSRRGTDVP